MHIEMPIDAILCYVTLLIFIILAIIYYFYLYFFHFSQNLILVNYYTNNEYIEVNALKKSMWWLSPGIILILLGLVFGPVGIALHYNYINKKKDELQQLINDYNDLNNSVQNIKNENTELILINQRLQKENIDYKNNLNDYNIVTNKLKPLGVLDYFSIEELITVYRDLLLLFPANNAINNIIKLKEYYLLSIEELNKIISEDVNINSCLLYFPYIIKYFQDTKDQNYSDLIDYLNERTNNLNKILQYTKDFNINYSSYKDTVFFLEQFLFYNNINNIPKTYDLIMTQNILSKIITELEKIEPYNNISGDPNNAVIYLKELSKTLIEINYNKDGNISSTEFIRRLYNSQS